MKTFNLPVLLIRLMVGIVYFSEGLQKFMFPDTVGTARFARIGFPAPAFVSHFVGSFEVICGFFVLIGLLTRWASIPLLIIILVAIYTTKIPIFHDQGFWTMMHEARTDFCMLIGTIFLLLTGGRDISLDHQLRGPGR